MILNVLSISCTQIGIRLSKLNHFLLLVIRLSKCIIPTSRIRVKVAYLMIKQHKYNLLMFLKKDLGCKYLFIAFSLYTGLARSGQCPTFISESYQILWSGSIMSLSTPMNYGFHFQAYRLVQYQCDGTPQFDFTQHVKE